MTELVGWLAAGLTLLTFSMHSMAALRLAAICANLCFIGYGLLAGLTPVLALHLLLLPCNIVRLVQLRRSEPGPPQARTRAAPPRRRAMESPAIHSGADLL